MVKKKKVTAKSTQESIESGKLKESKSDSAPKSSYGRGLAAPEAIPGLDITQVLSSIEKHIGVGSTGLGAKNEGRLSTGLLCLDMILGGGITAGWYTMFGFEQTCKSTSANTIMASSVAGKVPILTMSDYEGSSQSDYLQNMINTLGIRADVTDVFGVRDRVGNYVKIPRVRYLPLDTGEQFFDYLSMLERTLPDKIYSAGSWWYVYANTRENLKRLKESGAEYDKKMFSKHNKFYVPAPDGGLQALMIVDSYPAMLPERLDVDDPGAGLAAVARMFAEQLPRVKGKMRRKRIAVIGVNQLREVPMAKYGPPEKEPGGQALRFFSDCRIKHTARAISAVPDAKRMKDGPFEAEKSVEYEGGKDTYRYISVKAEKNKLSQPYLTGFLRLWIEDGNGDARGFDPVWDTLQYLRQTGQIKEKKKRENMLLQVKDNEAKKPIDWMQFKTLILGTKEQISEVCKAAQMKPFYIRKMCFKQMASGAGIDMFYEQKRARAKSTEEDEDEDEDD